MDDLQEDGDQLIFKVVNLTLVFFGLFLISIHYNFICWVMQALAKYSNKQKQIILYE
jgi:hypothetical protein